MARLVGEVGDKVDGAPVVYLLIMRFSGAKKYDFTGFLLPPETHLPDGNARKRLVLLTGSLHFVGTEDTKSRFFFPDRVVENVDASRETEVGRVGGSGDSHPGEGGQGRTESATESHPETGSRLGVSAWDSIAPLAHSARPAYLTIPVSHMYSAEPKIRQPMK
jgi:hypothetical protein